MIGGPAFRLRPETLAQPLESKQMDTVAARKILNEWMARLRAVPYPELASRVGSVTTDEVARDSERSWQLEIEVDWDDEPEGDVRVVVSIDDGGLRAFVPLSEAFIKAPSGEFVGEESRRVTP